MAFSDPQSLTINTVATSLPRTQFGTNLGVFQTPDGTVKLSVSHQYGKRNRHVIRVDSNKIAADPFVSTVNQKVSLSAYVVIDTPASGYTQAEQKTFVDALTAYMTASTGANVTRVLGGEI